MLKYSSKHWDDAGRPGPDCRAALFSAADKFHMIPGARRSLHVQAATFPGLGASLLSVQSSGHEINLEDSRFLTFMMPSAGLTQVRMDRRQHRIGEGQVLAVAQGLDAGTKEAEDMLRATQRGWISGRDECWKEPELRACVQTAYQRREAELVAWFLLEQASNIVELSCGDGARRLTIYEFPTPLPGIRVEEGDGVHVGAQSAAETPGSYYVSSWGGVTLEGAEISVTDVYGTEIPCRPVN